MSYRARINRKIGDIIRSLGYEVRRVPRNPSDPLEVQKSLCPAAEIIFDVGANVGQTARGYREKFPGAHIWSFEPFEGSYRSLCTALRDDPKFHPVNLALSDHSGAAEFHINRNSVTNSLLSTSRGAHSVIRSDMSETVSKVNVALTTIDEFRAANAIERIDILKLDIQGAERLALAGARGSLAEKRIGLVYTEVSFASLYDGQTTLDELWSILTPWGYRFHSFHSPNIGADGALAWADVLFQSAAS